MVDVVGEEDRISNLPDAILVNILSLLPTKSAFCTSILSKRWSYVWTSIPIVDLRNPGSPRPLSNEGYSTTRNIMFAETVMNFLDRMLFLHEMPNLKKFYLKTTDHHFDSFRVNAWIITLIRRKIEELILDLSLLTPYVLPLCLFTSESLTKLELKMHYAVLNLPTSICFPKLKILLLTDVSFEDENLAQQLFSNCPVLDELSLTCCRWVDMNFVCISVPTLKSLFINCCSDYYFPTYVLKIYAPSLMSLRHAGPLPFDYVLDSFPSLVDADIQYMRIEDTSRSSNVSFKLFEKLSNVELLKMSEFTMKALSLADDSITNLPSFCNLIRLEVNWRIETLFDFLHISPNLESLVFIEGSCHEAHDRYNGDDELDWTPNSVPLCLLVNLTSVEFRDFTAYPEELNVVKSFLKIARVLQTITINASYALSQDLKGSTKYRLSMFPKASASCVIKFSSSNYSYQL